MQYLKKIAGTQLFKISSLNTVSVLVRIAGGLAASKIIALFVGPAGLALVGNFRNFLTSVDSFSTLGLQNGIIKYVAEYEKDEGKLNTVLATVFISILGVILFISSLLLIGAPWWNGLIFGNSHDFSWVFTVLAFSLPWYTGNLVFIAVLNGLGKYKNVISISIWGNVTGVLLSALIIWKMHTLGALLSLIVSPALMFLFSFYLLQKQLTGFGFLQVKNFSTPLFKNLLSYSYMALVTAILGPVIYISMRNGIIKNYNIEDAGYWEAMNRISAFYLMFFSTILTLYFLPKLSIAKTDAETKKVFYSYFKGIVPLFVVGAIVLYFLRGFIIRVLLTEKFLPMANLFFWQLAGDFFKVASLILGFEFFAKKMTKAFIVTEFLSFTILFTSSYYLIREYGAEGAVMAHTITYFSLLCGLVIYFRKKLF